MLVQQALLSCLAVAGTFCNCTKGHVDGGAAGGDRSLVNHVWTGADIQYYLGELYQEPGILCSPRGAYAVAYRKMTRLRDDARCGIGSAIEKDMEPQSEIAAILNDALADCMTRFFVAILNQTAPGADLGNTWGSLYSDIRTKNFNTLHSTMSSTALYLTSHMGFCLSALPHANNLWKGRPTDKTISQRIATIQTEYFATYSAFNKFLAGSLNAVISALDRAKLIRNAEHLLSFSASISKILGAPVEVYL